MGFTNITNGTNLQSLSLINELVHGINERYYTAIGFPDHTPLFKDLDDIQYFYVWRHLQQNELLYGLGHLYWPLDTSLEGCTKDTLPKPYAQIGDDFKQLYTDAGMPKGFRRAQTGYPLDWTNYNDSAFTYGLIEVGDIIGPWLWVDIQNILRAMRTRVSWLTFCGSEYYVCHGCPPITTFPFYCPTAPSGCNNYTITEVYSHCYNDMWPPSPESVCSDLIINARAEYSPAPPDATWRVKLWRHMGDVTAITYLYPGASYSLDVYAYADLTGWPSYLGHPFIMDDCDISKPYIYEYLKHVSDIETQVFIDDHTYGKIYTNPAWEADVQLCLTFDPNTHHEFCGGGNASVESAGVFHYNFIWD